LRIEAVAAKFNSAGRFDAALEVDSTEIGDLNRERLLDAADFQQVSVEIAEEVTPRSCHATVLRPSGPGRAADDLLG
jgi:hypothetical protein